MRPLAPAPTASFPPWLEAAAGVALAVAIVCAVAVAVDVARRPPRMRVMAAVWPLTMLFGSLLWLLAYLRWGRARRRGDDRPLPDRSFAVSTFVGTCHCGAGCTLGDILVETLVFLLPGVAILGGAQWLFSDEIFAVWVLAYVAAYLIGIAFQYLAIAPMGGRTRGQALKDAVKADTLSITAWQVGMYGTMAIAQFAVFPAAFGGRAPVDGPVFWAMMQLAMVAGFVVAYPVNAWLIRRGVKERM